MLCSPAARSFGVHAWSRSESRRPRLRRAPVRPCRGYRDAVGTRPENGIGRQTDLRATRVPTSRARRFPAGLENRESPSMRSRPCVRDARGLPPRASNVLMMENIFLHDPTDNASRALPQSVVSHIKRQEWRPLRRQSDTANQHEDGAGAAMHDTRCSTSTMVQRSPRFTGTPQYRRSGFSSVPGFSRCGVHAEKSARGREKFATSTLQGAPLKSLEFGLRTCERSVRKSESVN